MKDEKEYAALSAKIDVMLQSFSGDYAFVSDIGVSKKVRERIMSDYRSAGGWTVEFGDDQRDGNWLKFS